MEDKSPLIEVPFAPVEYERLPTRVWVLGGLLVAIGVTTFILMSMDAKSAGSYLYLFLYSIPSNAAISLFPHEPILIYYGTFANIWAAAAWATGGTVVAGVLDHRVFVPLLNYKKILAYKERRFYQKASRIFLRYPFLTLVVTGALPIPYFPFKFLCFSINYPLERYLAALAGARFPRYVALAWVGMTFAIPTWLLIATVVIVFTVYLIRGAPVIRRRLRARRKAARERISSAA